MEITSLPTPLHIDGATLTPIVRKALHRETFTLQDWCVNQLGGGAGNPVSGGLYRFEGIGQDQDHAQIPWAIVLKVVQSPANVGWENMGEGDDQTHWNYWKREPIIYQSGFLETIPASLTAPRCFEVVEKPGNMIWLWLENIIDSYGGTWSLERYALTARHLGQLNGTYLSARPLPTFPWLSRHRLRQWLEITPWQMVPWEHPRVLERYPPLAENTFQHLLADSDRFLHKLAQLPQTLCHGDTYPTNFMSRELPHGQTQTVALDWALAGISPVGADLGQLVFGAQNNLKEVAPKEVDGALFESYLDGLRDSGCHVEAQEVRLGYTAFAAFQVGLFQILMLGDLKESGTPIELVRDRPATPDCFEGVMAVEAYKLLGYAARQA